MYETWNAWGTLSQNGITPDAPPGFRDEFFSYVLAPIAVNANSLLIPAGSSGSVSLLIQTDSNFLWFGLELPPYNIEYNIRTSDGYFLADRLINNLGTQWGGPQFGTPIFPALYLKAGTTVKFDYNNLDADLYNFQVVFHGIKRYTKAS